MKKFIIALSVSIISLLLIAFLLVYSGVIWRSPAYYIVGREIKPAVPFMTMAAYDTLGAGHPRPYHFEINGTKGSAYIMGIGHTNDPKDPQIAALKRAWAEFNPTIALVEGRLGFLFSWFQDPVEKLGEGGATVALAKAKGVPFYTWEPDRQTEVSVLLESFKPHQVALFYSLRPYLSNYRFGKPADPDKTINDYISSRTDHDGIRGLLSSYRDVDSIWRADKISEKDWRESSDEQGWPKGYLADIFAASNEVRDIHMYNIIRELTARGERVFVTMGASHAFRMEKAFRTAGF